MLDVSQEHRARADQQDTLGAEPAPGRERAERGRVAQVREQVGLHEADPLGTDTGGCDGEHLRGRVDSGDLARVAEQGAAALRVLPEMPLYARVDGVVRDGSLIVTAGPERVGEIAAARIAASACSASPAR